MTTGGRRAVGGGGGGKSWKVKKRKQAKTLNDMIESNEVKDFNVSIMEKCGGIMDTKERDGDQRGKLDQKRLRKFCKCKQFFFFFSNITIRLKISLRSFLLKG